MTVVKDDSGQEAVDDKGDMPGEGDAYVPSQRRLDRERHKRTRARRATAIAAVSTLVTAVVLYVVVVSAPGWERTKETFFDGHYAREAFPKVLEGLWLNIRLLLICGVLVLVLGMLIAIARTLRGPVFFPLRVLAAAYTDFFRGLPLIINLMIVVFGVPALRLQGVTVDPVWLGGAALTLTYSAYVAEVFRAGIESVHPSQRAAARSLGLSNRQALRHVVLPQAVQPAGAALVERSGVPPEGHRACVDRRRDRRRTGVRHHRAARPELHAVHRRGARLRGVDHPDDPLHGLGDRADGPAARPGRHDMSDDNTSPVLRMESVRKTFGTSVVLRDVDLEVPPHTVTALIGASGSGKSTLLRCANLLEDIDDGAIWLDGEEITDPRVDPDAIRRRIGVVFQAYNLFPHMTVLENITLAPRRVHGVSRAEAEAHARELLERLGLGDKAGAYPDRLSGGQQQRVAIVRALAVRPRLLLFDEITAALDPELVGEVLAVVRDLKDEGMTMVLATHEMGFARDVADQVCFLDGGVVLERGTAQQIFGDPQQERTQRFLRRIVEAGRL